MPISEELLKRLADPETKLALSLASEAELTKLRQAIAAGTARRRDGRAASPTALDGALIAQSRKVVYAIEDGIPNLLIDERLELSDAL